MIHLRDSYDAPVLRPVLTRRAAVRVGLFEEATETYDFSALGSDAIDEWSTDVEIEEEKRRKRTGDSGSGAPTIRPPSSAGLAVVKAVQASLLKLGYDLGPKGVDGIVGPYTRAAITKFKVDHSISPADGTIDAKLRAALDSAVRSAGAKSSALPAGAAIGMSGTDVVVAIVIVVAVGAGIYLLWR